MTPFPRKDFKALLASILNLPPAYVTWQGEKDNSPLFPGKQFLWGSLLVGARSRTQVGGDDLRRTDNADGSFSTIQVGRRQIVVSCRLEVYDSVDNVIADDVLDTLQTRAWQPSNLATLNAMGLVFETAGSITPLPTYKNSRYISAAVVDLTLAHGVTETATYPGPNKSIGEVFGTGTYTTESGGTTTTAIDVKETVHP